MNSYYDPHMIAARAAGRAWANANPMVEDTGTKGGPWDLAATKYASSFNDRGVVVADLYLGFMDGASGAEE